jgi:hypothetical protein
MAGALLVRELRDGRLQILDGHLRAETAASAVVPVLVLDLDDSEAEKLLLTFDPLGSLAGTDEGRLADLLAGVETRSDSIRELFDHLASTNREGIDAAPAEVELAPCYQVVVEVEDEASQRSLYERLRSEGRRCRVLTL